MSAAQIIFVTGTDTEIGKTELAVHIARQLTRTGRAVLAIKPVESGCSALRPEQEDGVRLANATGQADPKQAWIRLKAPLAPPEAADLEGRSLDATSWINKIRALQDSADVILVEGAGGLLSPLTWDATAVDLIIALDAKVLIIAPDKLGTLNQTRLTLEHLLRHQASVVGVIFNEPEQHDSSTGRNPGALARLYPELRIGRFPRIPRSGAAPGAVASFTSWFVNP